VSGLGARLGINLMAWSDAVGEAELALLPRLAALGYDGVELPLLAPERIDADGVRAALAAAGLACTASGALPRGASLLDPAERARGVAWIDRCLALAADCGATLLCGPFYAPVGALPGRPPTAAEWDSCVVGLREAGARAADRGVTLAIEPLNRFETHFLNTAADALRLLAAVDRPAVGLHLDSFHMNIEEQDPAAAIRRAGARLVHVHLSANDRGAVGSGHIDWDGLRDALAAAGYGGPARWLVAETFAGSIPAIAAATAIWRPIAPDPWAYAAASLAYMRRVFGQPSKPQRVAP
jgi:D-psicose/D-tagatose/L-ribulose 3-epimerase